MKRTSSVSTCRPLLLAVALLAGPGAASATEPAVKGSAERRAVEKSPPAAKSGKPAAAKPGVTTGDDDDINDLEVQRKARAAPVKPGKEKPSK
jgi:hypothetical protein